MNDIYDQVLSVFRRALRCKLEPGNFGVEDISEWDSLTHIKLVIELESAFGITINADDIPGLYSNFNAVADYVVKAVSED